MNEILLKAGHCVIGDAHAGSPRQVSLLEWEHVNEAATDTELKPGDFGENITTEGADLASFNIGDRILIGDSVVI